MTFLNPALLWGILAVALPIALHFWHQQRAKPMPWAMLRWLETPNQPPKRGFRFDNWLLLLLRCLLLVALSFLLAQPVFPDKKTSPTTRAVHLVEPDKRLVDTYRFELEQAIKRGENVYWTTEPLSPITDPDDLPRAQPLNPLTLQIAIDEATLPQVGLHLYLRNSPAWTDAPPFWVPAPFVLHPGTAPAETPKPFLALASGKQLAVDDKRQLAVSVANNQSTKPVATAPLRVLMQFTDAAERATVRAALAALTDVYGITYQLDEQPVTNTIYAWVLADKPVINPNPATIYTLTSQAIRTDLPNVQYLPGPLTATANEAVSNGRLPELLGRQLVNGLGLSGGLQPLSQQAFAALFHPDKALLTDALPTTHPRNALQNGLLVLFLCLLLAERWLAIKRGV
jgi:Aerotolerance regulator N-terminal